MQRAELFEAPSEGRVVAADAADGGHLVENGAGHGGAHLRRPRLQLVEQSERGDKGGGGMAADEAGRQKIMAAWGRWFGSLGDRVVDGGNPFGQSTAVAANGVSSAASSGLTGYSIIKADSLQSAAEAAKSCPILSDGGSIEVYETFQVM